MTSEKKNVLLACYSFPPNPGIGGRRWGKLAKGLAIEGYHVYVISARPRSGVKQSPWTQDVDHSNIHVHYLDRNYPDFLFDPVKSLYDKIRYRVAIQWLKLRFNGTIFDTALAWEKSFTELANSLIEQHNINEAIVTGAPFSLMYYMAQIKSKRPSLRLICDYRDPWLTGIYYGIQHLGEKRAAFEAHKQDVVFKYSDVITCPNDVLMKEIEENGPVITNGPHFESIEHFYDESELAPFLKSTDKSNDTIKVVYGGTLYPGVEKHLSELNQFLTKVQQEDQELYRRLSIDFYGDKDWSQLFKDHQQVVQFSAQIGQQIFDRITEADILMILYADHNSDYPTTKFFEYLPFKKPYWYVGHRGKVAERIETDGLGMCLDAKFNSEQLVKLAQWQPSVDIKAHSLTARTNQLIKLLGH